MRQTFPTLFINKTSKHLFKSKTPMYYWALANCWIVGYCKLGIYLIYTWVNWDTERVFRDGFLWKCPMVALAWAEVVSDMIQGFPPTTIKLQERWKKRHIRTAISFLFLRKNSENWLMLRKFQRWSTFIFLYFRRSTQIRSSILEKIVNVKM